METAQPPRDRNVVLVGAGHAHVEVLRLFGMHPMPGARVTLITRQMETPYSGMLPGVVAGLYETRDAHIDTQPLARFAQARLYHTEVIGLDLEAKQLICGDRPPVPYDIVSFDIGSVPSARDVPGVTENAIPVKPIDGFLARFERARARVLGRNGAASIGVIGGGAGGVELILSLHRRLASDVAAAGWNLGDLRFTLVTAASELLPTFPERMQRRFADVLAERGIRVMTGAKAMEVRAGGVLVEGTGWIALDEIFWTTRAAPADWLAATGLALDAEGFIRVGATLQSVSHPDVFAAGDVASIEGYDLPKSGVYAVRSGPPLARNLRRFMEGKPLRPYRPQREALYIISTGERYALAARNGFTIEGACVWRLKDYIDRRFMAKYQRLPGAADQVSPAGSSAAGL